MADDNMHIGSIVPEPDEREYRCYYRGREFVFQLHPDVAKPTIYSQLLLNHVQVYPGDSILDIGTGTGLFAISLASLMPVSKVIAVDINPQAVALCQHNAVLNGINPLLLQVLQGNLFESTGDECFDLILCSPRQTPTPFEILQQERKTNPYFYLSTSGGVDGMEFIKPLIRESPAHLKSRGKLQIVIVDYLAAQVRQLMEAADLEVEQTASLVTGLTAMTTLRKHYIESTLDWHFSTDSNGKEYMHVLILTGQKK